jgi:PKD repeat protein
MKKLITLILLLTVASLVGFSQPAFTPSSGSGCAPFAVNFTNLSSLPSVYFEWDFGDGTTLNGVNNPSHTYTNGGNYTVSMYAYDGAMTYIGNYSYNITVYGGATDFSVSNPTVCPNQSVNFYNWESSPYHNWNFGDGTTASSSDPWMEHTYTTDGIYTVSCEYYDATCGTWYTIYETVVVSSSLPHFGGSPNISVNESTVCPGSAVDFYVGGGNFSGYNWDFGNGDFGNGFSVSSTYNSLGAYTASLVLFNGCGVDTTLTEIITVSNSIPAPAVTISGPSQVCPGEQFNLNAFGSSNLTYTWDFGDGSPLQTDGYNYGYHIYDAAGIYTVELTVENLCGNTSISTFVIEASPTAPIVNGYFNVNPNETCPGDAVNFYVPWGYDYYIDFGDGSSTTDGYNHSYAMPGVYPVYAILQNTCGMTETLYDTVYVQTNLPFNGTADIYANPLGACPGEDINFSAPFGYSSYYWTLGDGNTSPYAEVNHPYVNSGNYNVSLTMVNGCGSDTTVYSMVQVLDNLPVQNLDWDVFGNEVCPGTEVFMIVENNDELEVVWDFGNGSSSTELYTSYIYDTPGTYTVTLTATNSCGNDSVVTHQIDVTNGLTPDLSMLQFEAQSPGCVGDNLYFAVMPAGLGTYAWNFGDGNTGFSDQLLFADGAPFLVGFHAFSNPGTYNATLTLTNACGISADSTVLIEVGDLTSGVPVDVTFWYDETAITCEGQPVSFTGVGAGTYIWDFGDGSGSIITYTSFEPVWHTYDDDGMYIVTVTGLNNCGGSDSENEDIFIPNSEINVVTNTVTDADCGINNGVAIVSATGGSQPYSYSWTNGDQGVIADSLGSGIYVVTVTDNNGCSTEAISSVSDDQGPVILLENILDNECFGEDNGVITVSILGGAPPYDILWSNGDATEDIFNLEAGPYEIFVTDANGCFSAKSFTVEQPQESVVSVFTQPADCGLNNGVAAATISDAVPPFNFIWPNTSGSGSETGGLAPGVYDLMVIDGNTCLLHATFAINETNAPIVVTDSIADPTCSGALSAIYISTIGGVGPFDFTWSNGTSNEDLTNVLPGEYSVEVEGSNGCSAFMFFDVEMSSPDETNICIVTVDTITNTNLVVWSPLNAPDVVSYNIYKESSQSGLYFLVANQSADSLSQYFDYASNPAIRSWRYKVAALDDCGNEAELSEPHKTIHLTSNKGIGGEVNLIWDHYNGFSYDTYYIYRYHPSTGWMTIDSVGSSNISYTDLAPPGDSSLIYMIGINSPTTCTATKAQDHNSTRSNKSSINMPESELNTIDEEHTAALSIYPNPTSGLVQVTYSSTITAVAVYDLSGQLVYSANNSTSVLSVDCTEFARGVYTVQLTTENGMLYSKLVKQ